MTSLGLGHCSLQSSYRIHSRTLSTHPPQLLHLSSRFCACSGDRTPRGVRRTVQYVMEGLHDLGEELGRLKYLLLVSSSFAFQDFMKKSAA